MLQEEKDLNYISEVMSDLNRNGFVKGGMAESMLIDWQKELERKTSLKCKTCGSVAVKIEELNIIVCEKCEQEKIDKRWSKFFKRV